VPRGCARPSAGFARSAARPAGDRRVQRSVNRLVVLSGDAGRPRTSGDRGGSSGTRRESNGSGRRARVRLHRGSMSPLRMLQYSTHHGSQEDTIRRCAYSGMNLTVPKLLGRAMVSACALCVSPGSPLPPAPCALPFCRLSSFTNTQHTQVFFFTHVTQTTNHENFSQRKSAYIGTPRAPPPPPFWEPKDKI